MTAHDFQQAENWTAFSNKRFWDFRFEMPLVISKIGSFPNPHFNFQIPKSLISERNPVPQPGNSGGHRLPQELLGQQCVDRNSTIGKEMRRDRVAAVERADNGVG